LLQIWEAAASGELKIENGELKIESLKLKVGKIKAN
jgi:hypothetical protein